MIKKNIIIDRIFNKKPLEWIQDGIARNGYLLLKKSIKGQMKIDFRTSVMGFLKISNKYLYPS